MDLSASGIAQTSCSCIGYLLEYFWCRTIDIQKYLDENSTISIGDTFDTNTAIRIENDTVDEIIEYLDYVVCVTTDSRIRFLKTQAARITAARIATSRFAGTMTLEIAEFIRRLENQAWAALMRAFLRGSIRGLVSKDTTYQERLLHYKIREQGVINPDV